MLRILKNKLCHEWYIKKLHSSVTLILLCRCTSLLILVKVLELLSCNEFTEREISHISIFQTENLHQISSQKASSINSVCDLLLLYSSKWEIRLISLSLIIFLNTSWKRIVPVGDSKINKPWCVHVEQIPCVSLEPSLYRFSVERFLLIFLQSNNELHILYSVLRHKSLCWMWRLQQFVPGFFCVFGLGVYVALDVLLH